MLQTSPFMYQLTSSDEKGVVDLTKPLFIDDVLVEIERLSDCEKRIRCNEKVIQIQELGFLDNGGVGSATWLSSIAFFAKIRTSGKLQEIVKNKTVLELGSGIGLGGISAALADATSIYLTDFDNALLPLISTNIENNQIKNAKCAFLDWTNCQEENYKSLECDVILALDCVYRNNGRLLKFAILNNLKKGGTAIIINPERDGFSDFLYMLNVHGTIQHDTIRIKYDKDETILNFIIFVKNE